MLKALGFIWKRQETHGGQTGVCVTCSKCPKLDSEPGQLQQELQPPRLSSLCPNGSVLTNNLWRIEVCVGLKAVNENQPYQNL